MEHIQPHSYMQLWNGVNTFNLTSWCPFFPSIQLNDARTFMNKHIIWTSLLKVEDLLKRGIDVASQQPIFTDEKDDATSTH